MRMFHELWEELEDFTEDLYEGLQGKEVKTPKMRKVLVEGTFQTVRPAYLFAERVDNCIKIIFGISIIVSAITTSLLGFESMGGLVLYLIDSLLGRAIMILIGVSYFVIGLWKLIRISP